MNNYYFKKICIGALTPTEAFYLKVRLIRIKVDSIDEGFKTIDLSKTTEYVQFFSEVEFEGNGSVFIYPMKAMVDLYARPEFEKVMDEKDFKRFHEIWSIYNSNDLHPGSRSQEEFLMKNKTDPSVDKGHPGQIKILKDAGIYVDSTYQYASEWLVEWIPDMIIEEIILICEKGTNEEV